MTRFRQAAAAVASVAVLLSGCATTGETAGGPDRAALNQPHKPFQIYGNTYYVGTSGLASILVVSDYGSVLIDGGLPESAAQIVANIKALGFDPMEVKAILSSDPNVDQAGGIAELQKLTGAQVYAMRASQEALLKGGPPKGDPRYGMKSASFPKLQRVWIVQDDQLLGVGNVRLRVVATPGGTPGGTSWSWDACDGSKCLPAVYASNLAPLAGRRFYKGHPDVLKAYEASFKRLEDAPCELLLTPHPDDSGGLARLEQAGGKEDALKDEGACKNYVQQERARLKAATGG